MYPEYLQHSVTEFSQLSWIWLLLFGLFACRLGLEKQLPRSITIVGVQEFLGSVMEVVIEDLLEWNLLSGDQNGQLIDLVSTNRKKVSTQEEINTPKTIAIEMVERFRTKVKDILEKRTVDLEVEETMNKEKAIRNSSEFIMTKEENNTIKEESIMIKISRTRVISK